MTGWVDAANWLQKLRETFPDWAFLYDPWQNTWSALRGKNDRVTATTAIELNALLREKRKKHTYA
ncbi:hypothetical protein [Actinoallomurus iriomotensis]|uniref:Uncharacterized protein n=1 Tax=Actinoallomurus iriomotensis TaxID=478107 RepID=A0A9W6RFX9_9ACTN|nr:hypothetical protein [Actinoallomurus iriomotensis]GLY75033.1 hypothetical protein Airi01_033000 [Actinoallomurus iriomotensis]